MTNAKFKVVPPEPSAAERMLALFGQTRANGYEPVMGKPVEGKVKPKRVHEWCKTPTIDLWEQHLRGELGLGIIPPDEQGHVQFGAIDIDDYTVSASAIAEKIKRQGLPLITVQTKSGGAHLLLFAEPVDAELMDRALRSLAARLGLRLKEAGGETEIITTANVWMPHCGSARSGVKASGSAMTVAEFLHHAEAARQSPAQIAKLAATRPQQTEAPSGADGAAHAEQCLARYCAELAGMPDGAGRNDFLNRALFEMGRHVAAGRIERERVEDELRKAADASGMDRITVERMIRRRNGPVERGMREPPPDERSPVDGITKIDSDPPLYLVRVGNKTIEMELETITNYKQFKKLYFQHCNQMPPHLSQPKWEAKLSELMATAKYERAPAGVSLEEQFQQLLEEFATNRWKGEQRQDLLRGAPWHDDDNARHYFTMKALRDFLSREKADAFRSETAVKIGRRIRALGGDDARLTIKGRAVMAWWVPAGAVHEMPKMDTPRRRESPL